MLTASVGPQQVKRTFFFFRSRIIIGGRDAARLVSANFGRSLHARRARAARRYGNAVPHPDGSFSHATLQPRNTMSLFLIYWYYVRRPVIPTYRPKCFHKKCIRLRVRSANSFTNRLAKCASIVPTNTVYIHSM
ncbi:hypothetical protein GMOD_00006012 [Pyrenophora seminiperda CCB06]|uniref:Uncharacterized protein n=1 Tax=Pyrenophora seminiperda CCB06 TaxID=1302712 RepID=A0A3M7M450_9PLEO|nr:hypothetical protein GMOD_00006012 [Pyrenophora seminiperda CCB06]